MYTEFVRSIFLRRRLRRICVREFCAEMCAGEFARILCAEFVRRIWAPNLCAHLCGGEFARRVVSGMFVDIVRGVCGGKYFLVDDARGVFFLSPMCAGMFSGMCGGIRARKWAPGGRGGGGQKGPKKGQKCPKWPKMAQNGQKGGGGAQKGPKMAHFVPEWYTSGSGATAFDSTGWQKSPEYALIRIAAGPLFPPRDKSRRFAKVAKVADFGPPRKSPICLKWQKSPTSPPSESGASSVARSLLEKLSARLSPSSLSLHPQTPD